MLTLRTKTPFAVRDIRNKLIGDITIYLKVESLEMNENMVITNGFYYYINENNESVLLVSFRKIFTWTDVANVEPMMNPIDTPNFLNAVTQRITEFTFLILTIESGENYGTTVDDWEVTP